MKRIAIRNLKPIVIHRPIIEPARCGIDSEYIGMSRKWLEFVLLPICQYGRITELKFTNDQFRRGIGVVRTP